MEADSLNESLLPPTGPAPWWKSPCQLFSQLLPILQAGVPHEVVVPFPGVTGSLKGTFDLLVAFRTLWRPCQCKAWLAHLRAKSQHPHAPRVAGQGSCGFPAPGLCFPAHWPSLVLLPRQPARNGKERRFDANLNLTDRISCCRCLSVVSTDDVSGFLWWW